MIKGTYKDYTIFIRGTQMLAVHKSNEEAIVGDRKAVSYEIDMRYREVNSSDLTKFLIPEKFEAITV